MPFIVNKNKFNWLFVVFFFFFFSVALLYIRFIHITWLPFASLIKDVFAHNFASNYSIKFFFSSAQFFSPHILLLIRCAIWNAFHIWILLQCNVFGIWISCQIHLQFCVIKYTRTHTQNRSTESFMVDSRNLTFVSFFFRTHEKIT